MLIPQDGFTGEEMANALATISSIAGSGASASAALMDLTASVYAPTKSEDSEGGRTVTWALVDTVECRIDKVRAPRDMVIAGAQRTVTIYEVLFPLNEDVIDHLVRGQRRISIAGVGALEIINTDYGRSDAETLRAWCNFIGPGTGGDTGGLP